MPLLLLALACATTPDPGAAAPTAGADRARRVLFVGIDGMRSDAFVAADTPNLDALATRGALGLDASSQRSGVIQSAPGWLSIATGVEAARHGVLENDGYETRDPTRPTFLHLAHEAGLRTAAVAHWPDILVSVHDPADVDAGLLRDDAGVGSDAAALVAQGDTDVLFLHFDDVDHAGHATGFSPDNPSYTAAIAGVDAYLGPVLGAVQADGDADWLVVVTSDHGGSGTDHGDDIPTHTTVPFIVAAPGGPTGTLPAGVSHMDAHPTVLAWLGIAAAADLDGVSRL